MSGEKLSLHLQYLITKVKLDEHLKDKAKFLCRYNTLIYYIDQFQGLQNRFPYVVVKKTIFCPLQVLQMIRIYCAISDLICHLPFHSLQYQSFFFSKLESLPNMQQINFKSNFSYRKRIGNNSYIYICLPGELFNSDSSLLNIYGQLHLLMQHQANIDLHCKQNAMQFLLNIRHTN